MRAIGRSIAGILLFALVGLGVWYFGAMPLPDFLTGKADKDKLALLPQASVSLGFLAEPDHWLVFPVTSGINRIKIISNASIIDLDRIRQQRLADPSLRWDYALEVEVWTNGERPVLQRTHHLRADLAEFTWPDGRRYTPTFFLRDNLTPLTGTIISLDLAGLPTAGTLRIRLARKDAAINDVLVRVYQPEHLSEQRAALAWTRMSEKAKESISKASVYQHELLLDNEIRNLLLNSWQATGPRGAEGRDYRKRELYVLFDNDGEVADDPIPSTGILTDAQLWGTIPVPEGGGELRLDLETSPRMPKPDRNRPGETASIRWYGSTMFEHSEMPILLAQGRSTHHQRVEGGLLEIETPREMTVRAWLKTVENDREKTIEITPRPQYLRTFFASAVRPLAYVLEMRREPSILRLELRRMRLPTDTAEGRARYSILDAEGKILREGWIPLQLPVSHYDQVIGDYSLARMSEPGTFHFLLPATAHTVQIRAEQSLDDNLAPTLLVSAQTRPYRLAREMRVPEDSFDYDAAGKRIPAWFPLRPEGYEELVINNLSRVLLLQARPTVAKPEILAGNYQWEDIRPLGNWLARPLFTTREAGTPYREDVLPSTYTPLPLNRWIDLDLPRYQGRSTVNPSIVWMGDKKPIELQVDMPGRNTFSLRLAGPFAERELPPMKTGRERIRIRGPNSGKLFINHVKPSGDALVRRIAQRFTGQLVFDFERTMATEETLTIRLFQPAGQNGPGRLRVQVQSPSPPELTPLSAWMFAQRLATVRPDTTFNAPVFDTGGERSDAGQPIYVPFAADTPLGRYRITVNAQPGTRGYLGVTRLGPRTSPQRHIHIQPELRHVQLIE